MAFDRDKLKQQEHTLSFMQMVIITGFVGGVFWSAIAYCFHFLNFTSIEPNIILEPFTVGKWRTIWIGKIISIIAYGVISIGIAVIYYVVLKKFKSMWIGAIYGLALFAIVFFILNPIFPSMKPFWKLDLNTIITSCCIYILYGVFIGYSISFEQVQTEKFKKRMAEQQ
ncbi:YqhR family membrane protein [Heyndrickxia ginsengihumi]|uniref:Membrane protein YqhR n=1 Tax=Heyndrickxia ginsengihumi TaxID=363870 RepID=A0A6M0P831_9BACI|nr:YqhR family membrane protein [Heyndrickxia ginsengihumi]MBE6185097.1 hypothetical protein [Bacillus sp. (in: firmicutes)]MCM3022793.1 YqhR family membrane protein [Heyndrickxia ginsengihumi]NEY20060.1 hypothetical protein [Heyndrickxia ginsengihumi]